tara:strand:- start:2314 stop:2538 length:225 start_codon:yes stop_codon:yes gene_type:complete
MTLEELESRKQELQGELSKVENQLVEALKTVESLKQTKFSIAGAIALNNEYIEKTNDVGNDADSSIPPAQIAGV